MRPMLCIENAFDPVCEKLDATHWDGTPRLENWLIRYAGADNTPLNRELGVLLLVAMVRRARQPGCKFDIMAVLEGPQGCGKSSLATILAGDAENFTDAPLLSQKVQVVAETLQGKWVAEISELAGLKRSDVEDVKALISRTHDRTRLAYARNAENNPRRCVLIGTTNSPEYLTDDTGNRRFVPVRVKAIDLQALAADRDQLFAEAVQREKSYGALELPPPVRRAAAVAAAERRVTDPWTEHLREVLAVKESSERHAPKPPYEKLPSGAKRIASTKVRELLVLQLKDCHSGTDRRITNRMKELGWKKERWRDASGRRVRGFQKG
jgi:predicted P-loop ATPase